MQRFAEAIALFRRVLAAHPLAPSFVHAAIGMCALKLRQNEVARAAFVRALEIDEGKCALALLALAAMDINSADDEVVGAALERLNRMSGAFGRVESFHGSDAGLQYFKHYLTFHPNKHKQKFLLNKSGV
jgi:Tfp pilus assembly protein PilF